MLEEAFGDGSADEPAFECLRDHCEVIELGHRVPMADLQVLGDRVVFGDGKDPARLHHLKLEPGSEPELLTWSVETFAVLGDQVYTCGPTGAGTTRDLIRWGLDGSHRTLMPCTGHVAANDSAVYVSVVEERSGPVSGIKRFHSILELREDGSRRTVHQNLDESYYKIIASNTQVCWQDFAPTRGCVDLADLERSPPRRYDGATPMHLDDTSLYFEDSDGFLMRQDYRSFEPARQIVSNAEISSQGGLQTDDRWIYITLYKELDEGILWRIDRNSLEREPIARHAGRVLAQIGDWLLVGNALGLNKPLRLLKK